MSTMAAHSILEPEMEHIISNMNSWAKPQSVSTPLGKNFSYLLQVWEWLLPHYNKNLLELFWLSQLGIIPSTLLYLLSHMLLQLEMLSFLNQVRLLLTLQYVSRNSLINIWIQVQFF